MPQVLEITTLPPSRLPTCQSSIILPVTSMNHVEGGWPKDVKTEMRRKEPQAGDASAELIELRRRQAEAAGVYKKGYAKPLRVDSPAGTDLEADLNPEEGGRTPGSFKGFDQDTAPDEDTLHMDLVRTFEKRGRDSKRIYEAAKKRREAKKTRTASGRPGPGPGGGGGRFAPAESHVGRGSPFGMPRRSMPPRRTACTSVARPTRRRSCRSGRATGETSPLRCRACPRP